MLSCKSQEAHFEYDQDYTKYNKCFPATSLCCELLAAQGCITFIKYCCRSFMVILMSPIFFFSQTPMKLHKDQTDSKHSSSKMKLKRLIIQ